MSSKERHEARYQRRKAKRLAKVAERSAEYSHWDDVFGFDALKKGYEAVSKASRDRTPTQTWNANLLANTREIQHELEDGTWKSLGFNHFRILERGKARDILSVHISEKGIQNSFCNNCLIPILRPHLIYDNGASLKGKGTEFALNRFVEHLRYHFRKYGRKGGIYFFDFKSFFANIPIAPLKDEVHRYLLDSAMFQMYSMLVDYFGDVGLGLGSQVSQISAVFFPSRADHYMKDQLRVHCNGRYMDDGYIMHPEIEKLKELAKKFEAKCEEIGIKMNKAKCRIIKLTKQFVFLKTRFFITESGKIVQRVNRKAFPRERKRLRSFRRFIDMGIMSIRECYLNFHSWLLSLKRWKAFNSIVSIIAYFNKLFPEIDGGYTPTKVKERRHKVFNYMAKVAKAA